MRIFFRKVISMVMSCTIMASVLCLDWRSINAGAVSAGNVQEQISDDYYFHCTFEDGTQNWVNRGAATINATSAQICKGAKSLSVSGRTAVWNGAAYTLDTGTFVPGKDYSFSAMVMYTSGESSEDVYMTLQYNDSEGTAYYPRVATTTLKKGQWGQLANKNYTIPSEATNVQLYIETPENLIDFYIDEAIGAVAGTVIAATIVGTNQRGDVNNDGKINSIDVSLAKLGAIEGFTNSAVSKRADINGDGKVDVADVKYLKEFVFSKIVEFPEIETPQENPWDTYQETAEASRLQIYKDSLYQIGNTERICEKIAKAQSGEQVTVGYLGGSITEGGGLPTCYARRSCDYFAQTFGTGSNVKYVNAGMSGTSSVVGNLRAEFELFNSKPDVIFIEFSVNDHPEEIYKKAFESLVKKCLAQDNQPAVIIIINRSKGGYSMQSQMAPVGKQYNIPIISMDNALTAAFKAGTMTWDDYGTDEYHPHEKGSQLIADCIGYFYRQALKTANKTDPYQLPGSSVYGSEYSTAEVVPISEFQNLKNGSFVYQTPVGRFPYGWIFTKNSANTPLTFTTTGKGVFILFKSNQNSSLGTLNVTVNGTTKKINGNRNYAWGGPDADIAYVQNQSGTLNVSISMDNAASDFSIYGIGIIK